MRLVHVSTKGSDVHYYAVVLLYLVHLCPREAGRVQSMNLPEDIFPARWRHSKREVPLMCSPRLGVFFH